MTAAAAAAAATRALRSALEDCAHPARPPSTDRFRHHLLTHLHAAPCPIACSSCPQVAREQAQKDKVRFEKAQAERAEMVKHLKMDFKLRDEDEIANERREGSSMSKGGKADFVAAAKTKGNEDMEGF